MSKRPGAGGGGLSGLLAKKSKLDETTASQRPASNGGVGGSGPRNPFLAHPIHHPERSIQIFLAQVRNTARSYLPKNTPMPIAKPFCEVEARIGILKINNRRVTSGGQKRASHSSSVVDGTAAATAAVPAFDATSLRAVEPPSMVSGVSKSHFVSWTQSGVSDVSPLSSALGCVVRDGTPDREVSAMLKRDLVESEYVETVFSGYPGDRRLCFPGYVDARHPVVRQKPGGQMEYKEKLQQMDLIVPAAKYDLRINLASEKVVVTDQMTVPDGWSVHRVKRRRSYRRRDANMAWQIDVTEVTSTPRGGGGGGDHHHGSNSSKKTSKVDYEIEMELQGPVLLKLINEESQEKVSALTKSLAQQLWWILQQINPLEDTVNVEELLQEHPNKHAVQLALATCGALKRYMDGHPPGPASGPTHFDSPLARPHETPSPALTNMKFCGCMPVNFSRHNIAEVQRSPENGFYLSEKTDGVRHFMVFTGDTVVLVDRAMKGKQPIPVVKDGNDPMAPVLSLVKPGTVLDGEVVMHRGVPNRHKARPVFIVFDVLAISTDLAVLHMPFERRLQLLTNAEFAAAAGDAVFADAAVADMSVTMPLVRKNFVHRTQISDLLRHVSEEKGFRSYRKLPVYNHLTDGIIFQPNLPYVCGTDVNLLKWKYLDTVTIDVEILQGGFHHHQRRADDDDDDDDPLNTGVMGPEQTSVDMSRYVKLPASERLRLEADRYESGGRIAEVGFDPHSGEWYYLTMRPDKEAPNHISTVLGTLLELSESLTTEELQYRLSVPPGQRDTYSKDLRGMMKQLLEHQRRKPSQQRN
jgi:mRNA capping enzyme, catalytic domain/mRNA capping enzyme, beta chain/mRNA capping enzyme, C-terminal domain